MIFTLPLAASMVCSMYIRQSLPLYAQEKLSDICAARFTKVNLTSTEYLASLLDANIVQAAAFRTSNPEVLTRKPIGQAPKILWLGCSDSRVSAEIATGATPGDIFVYRNIGNIFQETDISALAAITYAVKNLKVDTIVVVGHDSCGAVLYSYDLAKEIKAKGGPLTPSSPFIELENDWFTPITNLALAELNKTDSSSSIEPRWYGKNESDDLNRAAGLVTANIKQSVNNIANSSLVKETWASGQKLTIVDWLYHLESAELEDLNIGHSGVGIAAEKIMQPEYVEKGRGSRHQ